VVIDNVGVSRHHATVAFVGDRFVLRDEQSANGVFIGDERVEERELADGDVIQIGKFSLNFARQADLAVPDLAPETPPGPRPREMMHTFAMNEAQVKDLLSAGRGPVASPAHASAPSTGIGSTWLLLGGLAAIALLTALAAFVLF
jgi:pSer/pThr/pTyr-binding forkhead associated (FHA) protein